MTLALKSDRARPMKLLADTLALFFREWIRAAPPDETGAPLFDCLGCERSKLDVVHSCAPVCALAAAVEPVDIACDLAQAAL